MRSRFSTGPPHGALLDLLVVAGGLHDVVHEDARRHDRVRIERTRLDQVLHLCDRDTCGGRHHRVEVASRAPVYEISQAVAPVRLDEGEVREQRHLEHVMPAGDLARLLAVGDDRAVAGGRKEPADAGAARPNPLREGALRNQLDLELTLQELTLELAVLADVARDHLPDLARLEEDAQTELVHPRVVADDGEILRALRVQRSDQVFRDAAQAEPAHHQRCTIGNLRHRLGGAGDDLVHEYELYGRGGDGWPPPGRNQPHWGSALANVVKSRRRGSPQPGITASA